MVFCVKTEFISKKSPLICTNFNNCVKLLLCKCVCAVEGKYVCGGVELVICEGYSFPSNCYEFGYDMHFGR